MTWKEKKEGNVITKVGLRLSYIKSHEVKPNIENPGQQKRFPYKFYLTVEIIETRQSENILIWVL